MDIITTSDYWSFLLKSRETSYLGLIYRVPPRLWRPIRVVQDELKKIDSRQSYTKPGIFHISVKGLGFLGEKIDDARYEIVFSKLSRILSDFRPFEIRFSGLGVFPNCIYVKIEDKAGVFKSINKRIGEELYDDVDHSVYDGEAFSPHVAIATFNTKDVTALIERVESQDLKDRNFGTATVFEIEVVEENLYLALGPEETQESAFAYVRSFQLK